ADLETDHDDDDENGDEDRKDDLDEQLGEVDFDDPTAMDEKLWESSGDEDDGGEDDGSGRRESEQQVEKKASRGKKDQELVAAEEEADPTEADSHSEEKADANQQEEDGKCDAEDAEDAEDETEQEDADERPQDDANYPPPLADVEDAGEQFDLPDDLDLGEYDADKDDGERDNGPDDAMEIEDDDKDAGAEDNQASPKEDVNEGSDAHQEASQEEEEGDQEDVVPGRDELAPAEEGEKDQQVEEHEKAEEEDQLIKPEGDKEPEYPQDHEEPSPDDDAAKAEGEDEASDENEQQPHHPPPPDERPSQPNAYGVEADKGKPSGDSQPLVSTADNNSSGGSGGGHEERRQEESALPNNAQPAGGNSQGPDSHQPRSAADGAKQQQQESLSASDEAQELQDKDVNPLRSLSDAIEQWQRRLRISEHTQDGEANEGEGVGQVEEQQPAVDANVEYEFVKDEEKHTAVGMADAEDEEQLRHNDDEGWKDREQRQADAMEIEHQEQEESGKSAQQNDASASEARMHLLQSLNRDEGGEGQDPGQKHDDEAASEDQKATLQSAAVADQRALLEADSMELERESVNEDPHILRPEESHGAQRSLEELREELERLIAEWHSEGNDRDMQLAASLWQKYQQATHDLSMVLTEQLRLVLAPTLATQLRGDYRTGRRLNMKRIIPYIASQFKKDKIWLRRTKPSKRQYQVMIAVDDSKSMASGGSTRSVELAYEALALITSSLNHLEVGQISILSFGERVRLLHPFDATFDQSAGARVLQQFTFNQDKTNVAELLNTSIQIFNEAKQSASAAAINPDLWQLQLIISDGVCEDHPRLRQLVRAAVEHRIMMVFVVIDQLGRQQGKPAPTAGSNALPSDSIMNIQRVRYVTASDGRMVLKMDRYLDTFPFDYYVVLRDIQGLPGVLADALRQYFSLVGTD
ncbi:AAA ATPase midasin, partial [Spiromyces aspiralis]